MMATYSPLSMEMDTPRSAWISSSPIRYVFHRSWVSISAMGLNTTPARRRFQCYTDDASRNRFNTFLHESGTSEGIWAVQSRTSIGISEMPAPPRVRLRRSAITADSSLAGAMRLPMRYTQIGVAALCAAFHASWTATLSMLWTIFTAKRWLPLRENSFLDFTLKSRSNPAVESSTD